MNLDAELLERYWRLDQRRRELERQARQLKAEADLLGRDIEAFLEQSGRQQLRRGDYLARWVETRAPVAWKQEFIRIAGAEEAIRLSLAAPWVRRLEVECISKEAEP